MQKTCLILLCAGLFCVQSYAEPEKVSHTIDKSVSKVAGNNIVSAKEMSEDLEFAISVLGDVHPKTYRGFSKKQQQLIKSLRSKITEPMEAEKFYFIVNEIFFSMKDGHTRLNPLKTKQNRFINVNLAWLHDGLYVTSNEGPLKQGDKVIAIGTRDVAELLNELARIIPSENLHYIKHIACKSLTSEAHLDKLNVIQNDSVDYLIKRGNIALSVSILLTTKSKNLSELKSNSWVRFQIDEQLSLGILTPDQCRYNAEYKNKLKDFFTEVKKRNIRHVAVDVRKNGGGNSQVVDEFLSYLDIRKYKGYSSEVRYSNATAQQRNTSKNKGYRKPMLRFNTRRNKKCPNSELVFNGKLYILVSVETFSSANWFAVIVKDNKLGTVIGEPTGNQPTSYGDVLGFQMPNTGFRFICSFKKWIRPETSNDPEDGLYPDVIVYTTIEDIIQKKDTQIEKLKEIVEAK